MDTSFFPNPLAGIGPDVEMDSGFPLAAVPRPTSREQDQLLQQRQVQTEQLLLHALGQPPGSVVLEAQLRGALVALEEMLMLLAGEASADVRYTRVCDQARQLRVYLQAVDTALGGGRLGSLFARYAAMHLVSRALNVPWPESLMPQRPEVTSTEGAQHGS